MDFNKEINMKLNFSFSQKINSYSIDRKTIDFNKELPLNFKDTKEDTLREISNLFRSMYQDIKSLLEKRSKDFFPSEEDNVENLNLDNL